MMSLLVAWVLIGTILAVLVALVIAIRAFVIPTKDTRPVELAEWLEYTAAQRPTGRAGTPLPANS